MTLQRHVTRVSSNQSQEKNLHHRKNFILHGFAGRLGNVLFQHASIYCIAKQNHLLPMFPNTSEIKFLRDPAGVTPRKTFDRTMKAMKEIAHRQERHCCSFDERLGTLSGEKNYTVFGYLQSWKYFEPCKEDLKTMLTFRDEFVAQAQSAVRALRLRFEHRTLVGVHIRMEDHTKSRAVNAGKRVATPQFFLKAMTYFRTRFRGDVIFVVITASPQWWLSEVTVSPDVTFLNRSHPAVDMELLSRMDHIIISVGTFGWWAAYRNNGTVVCCDDFYTPGSHYAKHFLNNATDYIYPAWIRM